MEEFNSNLESAEKRAKKVFGAKLLSLLFYRNTPVNIFESLQEFGQNQYVQGLINNGTGTVEEATFTDISRIFGVDKELLIDPYPCDYQDVIDACAGRSVRKDIEKRQTETKIIQPGRLEKLYDLGFTGLEGLS